MEKLFVRKVVVVTVVVVLIVVVVVCLLLGVFTVAAVTAGTTHAGMHRVDDGPNPPMRFSLAITVFCPFSFFNIP